MSRPFVTIGMPALDEETYIEAAIASVTPHSDTLDYEIIVADGGSSDMTASIVRRLSEADPRIRLVANKGRSQAAGLNLIADLADPKATILARADCHAVYPVDYVKACVDALRTSAAASVVVPMRTVGLTCMQRTIAAAQNSLIGNGGAVHRRASQRSRMVDHGHHAAFVLADFRSLGGYDESLVANEDAEYDLRVVASGRRIWLCGEAAILYFPRASLRALAMQYFRYGAGRAATLQMSGARPKLRQVLPLAVTLCCVVSLVLGSVDLRFTVAASGYYFICMLSGLVLAARQRRICPAAAGVAAVVMHHAWAAGFVVGSVEMQSGRSEHRRSWRAARHLEKLS